jgi:hypothetical protein
VRCYSEGELLAYLDQQLAPRQMAPVKNHLARCGRCCNCLAQLQAEGDRVSALLDPYHAATMGSSSRKKDSRYSMAGLCLDEQFVNTRGVDSILKRYQGYVAVAAAVVVLAGLFSFSPVRSFAAQVLQVFRVNQVQVLHFDPADVQQLQSALQANGKQIDTASFGTFTNQQLQDSSLVDANTATIDGQTITVPAAIGAYQRSGDLQLSQGAKLLATPKVDGINSFLTTLGSKSLLPANLDGQTFTVQIPGSVSASFEQPGATDSLILSRSLPPALTVPAGVDVAQVREALLAIPILPENMRNTLAGVNIYNNTLLIPDFAIDQRGGSIESVTVNGSQGVLITPPPQGSKTGPLHDLKLGNQLLPEHRINGKALIWPQGGVWNCLEGNFTLDQAVALAKSIN